MKNSIYKCQWRKIQSPLLMAQEENVPSASWLKGKLKFLPCPMSNATHSIWAGGLKCHNMNVWLNSALVYFLFIRIHNSWIVYMVTFPSYVLNFTGPDTLIQERAGIIHSVQPGDINATQAVSNLVSLFGLSFMMQLQIFHAKSSDNMVLRKL